MARRPPADLAIRFELDNAQAVLRAFRGLPKEASTELRDASLDLSRTLAKRIAAVGRTKGAQAALLSGTVKAKYDRVPAVKVGGTQAVGRHHTPARDLLIGSEFGHSGQGGRGRKSKDYAPHGFRPRHSPEGIWIYPTVRANGPLISARWNEAAEAIVTKFGS